MRLQHGTSEATSSILDVATLRRRCCGTLLHDSIDLGVRDKLSQEVGRKAMIVLTDGEDPGSQLKSKHSIEAAQKANAVWWQRAKARKFLT